MRRHVAAGAVGAFPPGALSAKLPLSILTDFEEFAAYDCRNKPDKTDKSSTLSLIHISVDECVGQYTRPRRAGEPQHSA